MKGRQLTNYTQRFRDGKINFIVATLDPTEYVDIYSLNNTLTHFQNLTFLTDPTIYASWFIKDKWMPFWGQNSFKFLNYFRDKNSMAQIENQLLP